MFFRESDELVGYFLGVRAALPQIKPVRAALSTPSVTKTVAEEPHLVIPKPVAATAPAQKSKIDQYADAFEEFEKGIFLK